MKRALTIFGLLAALALPASATVDLTLFNTFPLLDNANTPLQGLSTSGDLVQLILVGPNGVIDPPTLSGTVGGDDTLLCTTHVGAGLTSTNSGMLVQASILYPDIFGGNSNAFLRFWDSNTSANSGYYGTSMVFSLPAGDGFGLAEFDFAASSGSSRTTNIPFSATAAVPEPSNLFVVGLMVLGSWSVRRRRLTGRWLMIGISLMCWTGVARAQISLPLDVTATHSIADSTGNTLSGDNPANGGSSPRCRVQILEVGDGGIAHLPDLAGNPTSNDTIVAETVIGQGMQLDLSTSGRFSTSIYALPSTMDGHRLFARVFDAPTVGAATHWAQSATFVVSNAMVMDVSALGIRATTQPKGSNPLTTDSDGDGQTDYQEFLANTNPLNAADRLDVSGYVGSSVSVAGRAGRQYTLQRTTDNLNGAVSWADITGTAVLSSDQNLVLTDPNPPSTSKAFYRLKVTLP